MSITTTLSSVRRATALTAGTFATALVLAACGGGADTPDGAVEGFLDDGIEDLANAFADGDFDQALEISESHFCADDVAALEGMEEMFAEMAGEDAKIPEDWSYEIGEVSEDGDTATVEVEMTEDGDTSSETYDLVKEEDEWKICGQLS